MRNSNLKNTVAIGFAVALSAAATVTPIQAHAAKLPGTCDVVHNTLCSPKSWLDLLRTFFYPSTPAPVSAD